MELSIKKILILSKRLIVSVYGDLIFFLKYNLRRRLISDSLKQYIEYKKYPYYFIVGNASLFCLDDAKRYCKGKGIDVGGSIYPFPGARIVENNREENALSISDANDSLDYVFTSHCVEHLSKKEQSIFISECSRVIKKNGILYIYMPIENASLWKPELMKVHKQISDSESIIDLCISNGFKALAVNSTADLYFSKRFVFIKNS